MANPIKVVGYVAGGVVGGVLIRYSMYWRLLIMLLHYYIVPLSESPNIQRSLAVHWLAN
jgi:hypothetical protein